MVMYSKNLDLVTIPKFKNEDDMGRNDSEQVTILTSSYKHHGIQNK